MSDNKILASVARVVDVIIDEAHPFFRSYGDIGAIRYRLLDSSGKESDLKSLDLAYPMDRNIFSFPLAGEVVQLFIGPKAQDVVDIADTPKVYYGSSIAIWNHPHYNAHPDPGLRVGNPDPGPGVVERGDIYPMLPFMGDVLIEGRHGQSIRMTGVRANQQPLVNDQNNGKPLTIIRNGQKESSQSELDADGYTPQVEDINNDRTSIYLTSDHVIPLVPSSEERGSFLNFGPLNTEIYRGAQAIVQSDRVVLNAREESILLNAKEHISLSSTNTHIDGEERIVFNAPKIFLGTQAYKIRNAPRRDGPSEDVQQPAVLGGVAEAILLDMLEALRELIEQLSTPEVPDVWIPGVVKTAESVKELVEGIETRVLTELKSKKVFIE
tara:strand:- start:654 stop:1799 length:1146 start_codon:yes stop_codon:yes gene_type:complete